MTTPTTQPAAQQPVTPKNGATQQQQPSSQPPPASAAPDKEALIAQREEALAKKEAAFRNELKKNADEKKGLGAKLSEYEQLKKWKTEREQEDALAKLNPPAFLQKKYGDGWYDVIVQTKANGVPPADLIAAALSENDRKWEQRFEALRGELSQREVQQQQAGIEQARADVAASATDFYDANKGDYPILESYGDSSRVGQILGALIEKHFQDTGKLISAKDAADKLEAAEFQRLEKAAKHDKYAPKLQPGAKPANVSPSSGVPGSTEGVPSSTRRTLSNHLTASTPGRSPPLTDAERLERATRAFNAVRSKGQG